MNRLENSRTARAFRALLGVASVAAFLFAITLAAAPGLHLHLHTDAAQTQHECAATIIGSGKVQLGDSAPLLAGPAGAALIGTVATLHPAWVPSVFSSACIFEHAPPALS
ncbi:hypothetical protein BH20VER1_BH20VER1_03070 [soil metagenome]